ncbi:MAG: transposase [archaeon]
MDLRKQKGLQIFKTKTIQSGVDGWIVPSQTSNKKYFVRKDYSCSCPDHKERHCTCKHAFAVKYYLQIEKPDGTKHKIKLSYPQAWRAYTEAQKCEVNQFEVLLKDLLKEIEEPEYSFGRPKLSRKEVLFCAIQKVYSQLSSRRAYSLFKNAQGKNIINKTPNYNAINKILNEKEITSILKELITLSASPLKVIETSFSVDSSGFRTTRFNEYCKEKHGTKKEHKWVKAHICSGNKTNIVCSAEITQENGADCPQFKPLVETIAENGFNVQKMMADKAYSSRENLALVDDLNGIAFIPFRSNATGKSKGNSIWRKMYCYFQFNQEEFMQHYHARSNVETTFMAIKTKFGDCLKNKTFVSQTNELLCKIIAYNIAVLIHETHELGIKIEF